MATVNLRGSDLTVVYVDVDLGSGANDGSTPANALQAFPDVTTFNDDSLYLVRRTSTVIDYTKNVSGANRLSVMGMPMSGADYYDLLPTEAKTAWDADVATEVVLRGDATSDPWQLSGVNSGIYNLRLDSRTTNDLFNGHILVTGSGFTIKDSTIKVEGIDLSAGPDGSLTSLDIRCLNFSGNITSGVTIENCIFQHHDDSGVHFNFDSFDHDSVTITNCDFYGIQYSTSTMYGIFMNSEARNCNFENLTFVNKFNTLTNFSNMTMMNLNQAYECTFRNIDFNFPDTETGGGTKYGLLCNSTSYKSVYRDVTFFSAATQRVNGIRIQSHRKARIEDCVINIPNATDNQSYGVYASNCDNSTFENIEVNMGQATQGSQTAFFGSGSEGSCVTSCQFNSGGVAINSTGVNFYNCETYGAVLGTNPFIHLLNMGNESSTQDPFYQNNLDESLLYVETMDLSASSLISPLIQTSGVAIFEESPGVSLNMVPEDDFGRIYVNNEFVANLWHHETEYNRMFSTSAERVSGGGITVPADQTGYSIKANGLLDSGNIKQRAAVIAPKPFNGIPVTFSGTGYKRVTLYFSSRLSTPLNDTIWFELEVPSGPGTDTRTITTFGYDLIGAGVNDTSTWEGDNLLNSYKVELEFQLERDEVAYGRIHFDQETGIGYYYIDPVFFVEDL